MASTELIQAIAVTAELTGTTLSPTAASVMAMDLAEYPEEQVLRALVRVRRELKGKLTIADVISRIDDGRPGAEEAWSMMPRSESDTVVWTDEMASAHSVALPLIEAGELVPARMAFKEAYEKAVRHARDARIAPRWTASLGHDPLSRESKLQEAVTLGRLQAGHVAKLLPYREPVAASVLALGVKQ